MGKLTYSKPTYFQALNLLNVGALLPFAVIALFNIPTGDDFWSAHEVRHYGITQASVNFYKTVSPRYVALFLMNALNTLPYGMIWIFKVWPIVIIGALFVSYRRVLRALYGQQVPGAELTTLSCLLLMAHIASMRSLYEGLYWMSSTTGYAVSAIFFLNAVASAGQYINKGSLRAYVAGLGWAVLAAGCAELSYPLLVLLFAGVFYVAGRGKLFTAPFVVGMLVLIVVFGICLNAPSLKIRTGGLEEFSISRLLVAVGLSIKTVGYYLWIGGSNPVLLFGGAAFLLRSCTPGTSGGVQSAEPRKPSFLKQGILLPGLLVYGCCVYIPLYYAEATLPYPRVTVLFFTYLFMVVLLAFRLNREMISRFCVQFPLLTSTRTKRLVYFLAWVAFMGSVNFRQVTRELWEGTAQAYDREWQQRFRELKQSQRDTCQFTVLPHWSLALSGMKREHDNLNPFVHLDDFFSKTIILEQESPNK